MGEDALKVMIMSLGKEIEDLKNGPTNKLIEIRIKTLEKLYDDYRNQLEDLLNC